MPDDDQAPIVPASPRQNKKNQQYEAALRRQRGEVPTVTGPDEGVITPETLQPRIGQNNCPPELDWFHVADAHDKRESWMRDQVKRWLQDETGKHRATGGTFGSAEEETAAFSTRDETLTHRA